jgi:hypothetical protein
MATMDFTTKPLMLLGLMRWIQSVSMTAFNLGPELTRVDLTCDVKYIELHLVDFRTFI